jgi:7-cyano-7-deazaguanine synthase
MNRTSNPRSIVLLSGGLDSSTTLAVAIRDGYAPYALTFRYGQLRGVWPRRRESSAT